jgi:hypothetical protein
MKNFNQHFIIKIEEKHLHIFYEEKVNDFKNLFIHSQKVFWNSRKFNQQLKIFLENYGKKEYFLKKD